MLDSRAARERSHWAAVQRYQSKALGPDTRQPGGCFLRVSIQLIGERPCAKSLPDSSDASPRALAGCGPDFVRKASRKAFAVADRRPYMGRVLIPLNTTVRSNLVEVRFGPALLGFLAIQGSTSEE